MTFNSVEKAFNYKPDIKTSINSDFSQPKYSENSENMPNYELVSERWEN